MEKRPNYSIYYSTDYLIISPNYTILTEQFLKKMTIVFHFGDILHMFQDLLHIFGDLLHILGLLLHLFRNLLHIFQNLRQLLDINWKPHHV